MSPSQLMARRAIEALRSGVPSRAAIERLGTTQDTIRAQFEAALEAVADGAGAAPLLIAANFGDGKSHLLHYLQAAAARRGFVTAYLVVSPEMPLGRPPVVLKSLVEAAEAPGRTGKALRALFSDVRDGSRRLLEVREKCSAAGLSTRFEALLHLYDEYRADEEFRQQILDDFEGKSLNLTELRRRLRELGQLGLFDLQREAERLLAPDRIRLYALLCRALTGCGLVVLFDELERLRRFSRKQRFAAYEQLGWWAALAREPGSGILPVCARTTGFVEETLTGGLQDEQHYRVQSADLPAEQRKLGEQGLKLLTAKPLQIWPTGNEQLADLRYRLRDLYAEAYGGAPPEPGPAALGEMTMRKLIRSWITRWDLARYDPDYAADIEAGQVTFDTAEVGDDVLADGEE